MNNPLIQTTYAMSYNLNVIWTCKLTKYSNVAYNLKIKKKQYVNMLVRDYDYYISTSIENLNPINDWILIVEFKR